MKLDLHHTIKETTFAPATRSWSFQPYCNLHSEVSPSDWVKLLNPLSEYSHDEALLLCKQSEDVWVAWIPEHGEALLHISQFCA